MAATRTDLSGKRLRELAEAAQTLFCRQGYERSQVADVAKLMGVAVGTVYLYVESKEALFDLAVRFSAAEDGTWRDGLETPLKTPPPGATLAFLSVALEAGARWPVLEAAEALDRAVDPAAELRAVLAEQYDLAYQHRCVLRLLMRSALEFPGLSDVFVKGLRDRLLERLAHYLASRTLAGQFRRVPDFRATAALMIQTLSWANLQRPFEPGTGHWPDDAVRASSLDFMVHSVLLS